MSALVRSVDAGSGNATYTHSVSLTDKAHDCQLLPHIAPPEGGQNRSGGAPGQQHRTVSIDAGRIGYPDEDPAAAFSADLERLTGHAR